ncbi:unnamed protein product [Rotaria sp. Silwood1]|nr:unnamed protein product [Rotaria sp. Silwood1]CAF3800060.1 unnamed protein product [Rotaria sp. Silwood1]CAF4879826.1 unnamed protein product [Rotaria sp. Silwood1]CAF4916367.1 unnamed protein product [Rotaria sp. Silwood1]CAF4939116.1 unnamed protein product [Rotaria sp. Silwood1]
MRSRFTSVDIDNIVPSITANDSLDLGVSSSLDSQQQPRRRTNCVHNQRTNTERTIWNDAFEIRDDSNDLVPKTSYQQTSIEDSHRSDDQKLHDNAQQSTTNTENLNGSRDLISRFEHNPSSTTTTKKSLTNLSPTSPTSSSSTSRTIRSQIQDPSEKPLTTTTSLQSSTNSNTIMNGMTS